MLTQGQVRHSSVFGAVCHRIVIGPCFFAEETDCGTTYLDKLEQFFPQIEQLQPNIRFQQDGTPHWFNEVRMTWDNIFPGRWIGRGG